MSTILVKDREWEEAGSVRSSRNQPRVVRSVRRYKYPSDDYADLDEEVDRIIIRDSHTHRSGRTHSPEVHEDRIEVVRYNTHDDDDHHDHVSRVSHHDHNDRLSHRDWDTVSRRSHRSHAPPSHHPDDVEEVHITEIRETTGPPSHHDVREEIRVSEKYIERSPSPIAKSRSRSSSPTTRASTKITITKAEDDIILEPDPVRSPYTVEKYSKSTEYFSRPEPVPIIIRNDPAPAPAPQPIVIREDYTPREIIIRNEIINPRPEPQYQLVQRQEYDDRQLVRPQRREDDDYYYERHVRRERPGRERRDDYYEEEERRRRSRRDERDYYSDDDVEYRRKVRSSHTRSPSRHRRTLLEGAIGGAVAGEVMRSHRKRAGEEPGSHLAALGGMGALGAIGAEAFSRAKTWDRERNSDRGRSRSKSRHGRSHSISRRELLAGAAAVAAIGGAALVASRNKKKGETVITKVIEAPRRSRSRRRRDSTTHIVEEEVVETPKHDSKHRNQRVAQAGVLGASLAALGRARSRSKSKGRSRSRSRVREGIPIVAAGLGTAAVTGVVERLKGKKEERAISRSRSRSRSRSVSRRRSTSGRRHHGDRSASMVEYGDEPIYTEERVRRRSTHARSTSRGRQHRGSRSRSHSRSRSRSKAGTVLAGAAVGAAGLAAHEASKRRREDRRAERERRRRAKAEGRPADDTTSYTETTDSSQFYPSTHSFAPPPQQGIGYGPPSPGYPSPGFAPHSAGAAPIPRAYNPAEYGPTTGPTLPPEDHRYHSQTERYPSHDRRGGPENVSEPMLAPPSTISDGVNHDFGSVTPRTMSPARPPQTESHISSRSAKTVQFADDPQQSHSDSELERSSSRNHGERRRRSGRRPTSPASDNSDETIVLPDRFDNHGQPKPRQDSVADAVENFLRGNNKAGGMFNNVLDGFLGGGDASSSAGRDNRRRRSSDNYVKQDRRDRDRDREWDRRD